MSNRLTLVPEYIDIVHTPSLEFYKTATNLMSAFTSYTGAVSAAIDFEKSKVSNNVVESSAKLYKTLNNENFKITADDQTHSFDNVFKLFYIEKFQSLSSNLKSLITSSFSGTNIFFKNYSDDLGNLVDTPSVVDSSTSPYFDIEDIAFTYPNNIPASVYNKVSANELNTSINLSTATDALLKTSLKDLQVSVTLNTAKTAHGENLITDNLHVNRVYSYTNIISSQIKNVIGDMADFISFFKRVNYKDKDIDRKALFLIFTKDIENTKINIDILQNKLDKSPPNTITVSQSAQQEKVKTPSIAVDTEIN